MNVLSAQLFLFTLKFNLSESTMGMNLNKALELVSFCPLLHLPQDTFRELSSKATAERRSATRLMLRATHPRLIRETEDAMSSARLILFEPALLIACQ